MRTFRQFMLAMVVTSIAGVWYGSFTGRHEITVAAALWLIISGVILVWIAPTD